MSTYTNFFYDKQIRRFLQQFIRILSNFQVEMGNDDAGNRVLQQVPVFYGDASRQASQILRTNYPNLQVDGEMHVLSALNPKLRDTVYSKANINGRANVLVMPNLDAANIAMGLIRSLTDALLIGPFINGFRKPAHIVIPSVSSRGIFNMTALTVADIQAMK